VPAMLSKGFFAFVNDFAGLDVCDPLEIAIAKEGLQNPSS